MEWQSCKKVMLLILGMNFTLKQKKMSDLLNQNLF